MELPRPTATPAESDQRPGSVSNTPTCASLCRSLSPRLLQVCCGPRPPPPFGDPLPGGRGVKRHLLLFWASCVYHRLAHPGPKGKGGGRGRGGGRGERPARRSAERVALTHATLHAIVSSALPPCARARRRNTPPEKSLFPDTSPMSRQQRLLEN